MDQSAEREMLAQGARHRRTQAFVSHPSRRPPGHRRQYALPLSGLGRQRLSDSLSPRWRPDRAYLGCDGGESARSLPLYRSRSARPWRQRMVPHHRLRRRNPGKGCRGLHRRVGPRPAGARSANRWAASTRWLTRRAIANRSKHWWWWTSVRKSIRPARRPSANMPARLSSLRPKRFSNVR